MQIFKPEINNNGWEILPEHEQAVTDWQED
ncbi:unnamed protein product [Spirodela intermedia]|uniref:Uncharacterized protein n=2 Tax=Spirodela intermedia TaxID=51605 RepID=A0A7I8J525_SPIIN|nr:unnamed protein product [Spirodela intermedia]CAA6665337.1 unnamed protein product [Spirodela intermedia]CAA7402065.1 unnamed protein product [Spirodela intermedia]